MLTTFHCPSTQNSLDFTCGNGKKAVHTIYLSSSKQLLKQNPSPRNGSFCLPQLQFLYLNSPISAEPFPQTGGCSPATQQSEGSAQWVSLLASSSQPEKMNMASLENILKSFINFRVRCYKNALDLYLFKCSFCWAQCSFFCWIKREPRPAPASSQCFFLFVLLKQPKQIKLLHWRHHSTRNKIWFCCGSLWLLRSGVAGAPRWMWWLPGIGHHSGRDPEGCHMGWGEGQVASLGNSGLDFPFYRAFYPMRVV